MPNKETKRRAGRFLEYSNGLFQANREPQHGCRLEEQVVIKNKCGGRQRWIIPTVSQRDAAAVVDSRILLQVHYLKREIITMETEGGGAVWKKRGFHILMGGDEELVGCPHALTATVGR